MNKYQVKILHKINSELLSDWEDLWKQAENANIFNSYDWFVASEKSDQIKGLKIYAVYLDKKLVGLFPLTFTKCYGVPVAVPIGHKFIVDTAFLLKSFDPELIKTLFSEILKNENVYLTTLDETVVGLLKNIFPQLFFSLISVNPYVTFDTNPLSYFSGSKLRKLRQVLKVHANNLEFKEYNKHHNLLEQIQKMIGIEQHSAKKMRSKDIFSDNENVVFYTNLARYCKKFVRLFFVYYQKKPVVYAFCLQSAQKVIGYQTSYLPEYSKLSPGKIILRNILEQLATEDAEMFDFGGGVSAYKQQFTPKYLFQYNLYFSKNVLVMKWWKVINSIRRIKQMLLPEKHTRDHEFLFKEFNAKTV